MLVYDIEIIKAIRPKNGQMESSVQYCEGWHDHANMGVSVICAYDYDSDRYHVFCADNFNAFAMLAAKSKPLIGFNSVNFDDQVVHHVGLLVATEYDLLIQLWRAAGLGPKFEYPSHLGFGLDATAKANQIGGKTGTGELAPINWQRGKIGNVIDYCLEDVRLTKRLIDRVLRLGILQDPRFPDQVLTLPRP